MKQEFLLAFSGDWYRVYEKGASLFVDRFAQGRFSSLFCLSEGDAKDFFAAVTSRYLHMVYQEKDSICYALYDGVRLHKKQLFASGRVRGLKLISCGEFVHLFYTVLRDNESVFVHQLLGEGAKPPAVVMEVSEDAFSLHSHKNGDVTVLLTNKSGMQGILRYRWSKKGFEGFTPLDCGCYLSHPALFSEGDKLYVAGLASFDRFVNLLCLEKDMAEEDCRLTAVHLLSSHCDGLCLSCEDGVPHLRWCEGGLVMESHLGEKNHWSTPKRFLPGTGRENVLFHMETDGEKKDAFGYMMQGVPMFYSGEKLAELKQTPDSGNRPETHSSTQAASHPASKPSRHTPADEECLFVKRSVYAADMAAIRKVIDELNERVREMEDAK